MYFLMQTIWLSKIMLSQKQMTKKNKVKILNIFSRNVRSLQKTSQTLAKELAMKDAQIVKEKKPKFFSCHRFSLLILSVLDSS
jgi:uncharacterized membrane protein